MFQGAAQLNLDSKGRLAIPARHRDMLLAHCAGQLVLTADADGCLLLYPQPEWQPIRDKLLKLSALNPKIRALQRRLIGYAEDVVMDGAGRVERRATRFEEDLLIVDCAAAACRSAAFNCGSNRKSRDGVCRSQRLKK